VKKPVHSRQQAWQQALLAAQPQVLFSNDRAWYPAQVIAAHSHPFYQVDYFYGGYGKVSCAGTTYSVKPGDLFMSNPGDRHEFHAAPNLPLQGVSYKFQLKPRLRTRIPNWIANLAILPAPQQRELHELLRRGSGEFNGNREGRAEAAGALLALFFVLTVRYLDEHRREVERDGENKMSRLVTEYIKRCYHLPLTLNDLGRVAGLNPRYMCQRFSEETGQSPIAALTQERMAIAKNLLQSTTLPIAQIGAQVGYPDIFHFSKRFKALTGLSPKGFRGKHHFRPRKKTN
jgi:AraC-like DNA-binding protein